MSKSLSEVFGSERIHPFTLSEIPREIMELNNLLLINATSLGLRENDPSPLSLSGLPSGKSLRHDLQPSGNRFAQGSRIAWNPGANGLSMLVHQAAKALEIWTGDPVPSEVMISEAKMAMEVAQ